MSLRSEFQDLEPNRIHTAVIAWLRGRDPSAQLWLVAELLPISSWADEAYRLAESEAPDAVDERFLDVLARLAEQDIAAQGHLELQTLRSIGFAAQLGAQIDLALHLDPELEAGVPKLEAKRRAQMREDWALFAAELSKQARHWRHA